VHIGSELKAGPSNPNPDTITQLKNGTGSSSRLVLGNSFPFANIAISKGVQKFRRAKADQAHVGPSKGTFISDFKVYSSITVYST
jgi:hypothetical protein